MATVIERERPVSRSERYVEIDRTDSGGWVVAVVLLIVLALGIVWWLRYHNPVAPAATPANINVTVPVPSNSGGTGAGDGGAGAGSTGTGGSGTNY